MQEVTGYSNFQILKDSQAIAKKTQDLRLKYNMIRHKLLHATTLTVNDTKTGLFAVTNPPVFLLTSFSHDISPIVPSGSYPSSC